MSHEPNSDETEWGTSHMSRSRVTNIKESCHIWQKKFMAHMWMSHEPNILGRNCMRHVTHGKESCRTSKKKVMAHMWMSHEPNLLGRNCMRHVTHMKESCQTYEEIRNYVTHKQRVLAHVWMSLTHTLSFYLSPSHTHTHTHTPSPSPTTPQGKLNEAQHACERVVWLLYQSYLTSHVPYESCPIWIMSHMIYVPYESCPIWIMSHESFTWIMWMTHVQWERMMTHIKRLIYANICHIQKFVCLFCI